MILAIDVGNTHICLGTAEGNDVHQLARLATDSTRTEYEYAVLICRMLEMNGVDPKGFEGAIFSSVVPSVTGVLRDAIRFVTGKTALVVGKGLKTGLNIRIDDPAQLGSDLAVGAVAALADFTPPVIVLDMGTATTFSVLDRSGAFRGGAILPGVGLSFAALTGGTAQLTDIPIEAPEKCIGANTVDCMKSGAVFGTASMIDGMVERIEEELGEKASLVATGGLSERVIPYCRHKFSYDPELLLKGLAIIYWKNKK